MKPRTSLFVTFGAILLSITIVGGAVLTLQVGQPSRAIGNTTSHSSSVPALSAGESELQGGAKPTLPLWELNLPIGSLGSSRPEAIIQVNSAPPMFGSSSTSYSGHYWDGAYYSGGVGTSTTLEVTLQVPDDLPQSDSYFAIVSTWDNAGSYDQLGIYNYYGSWGISYSTSTYCAGTFFYSDYAAGLSPGQTYLFEMTISSGLVTFATYISSTMALVWSHQTNTGGSSFYLDSYYSCDGNSYGGYTDYEEVYTTTAPVPPYDFFFTNNTESGSLVTSWTPFSVSAPSVIEILTTGANVTIENEPFYLAFAGGGGSMTIESTAGAMYYYSIVSVAALSTSPPITLGQYSVPGGWSVADNPDQGTPPLTSELSFRIPSNSTPGTYEIGTVATAGTGDYSRLSLEVTVLPTLSVMTAASSRTGAIDLGQSIFYNARATGGSGGYQYTWTALPLGCEPENATAVRCAPNVTGNSSLSVNVNDSLGYTATSSVTLVAFPDPVATVVLPSGGPLQGSSIVIGSDVHGGAFPFSYTWVGLPSGCNSTNASFTCSLSSAGTYQIQLVVTDQNGWTTETNASLTVAPAIFGLPLWTFFTLVSLGALAIVLGVLLGASRRANRRRETPPKVEQSGSYPPGVESALVAGEGVPANQKGPAVSTVQAGMIPPPPPSRPETTPSTQPLPVPPMNRYCPWCGTRTARAATFCYGCGKPLPPP